MICDKKGRCIPDAPKDVVEGTRVILIRKFESLCVSKNQKLNIAEVSKVYGVRVDYDVELHFLNRKSGARPLHEGEAGDHADRRYYMVDFGCFAIYDSEPDEKTEKDQKVEPIPILKCVVCNQRAAMVMDACISCIKELVDKNKAITQFVQPRPENVHQEDESL
jgi:hypothetical protein